MKKILLSFLLATSLFANAQYSWSDQSTAYPVASSYTGDISIVDANIAWSMVQRTTATNFQRVSYTIDGGTTWTTKAVTLPSTSTLGIGNISAVSATTAYISVFPPGTTSPATQGVYKTINSGTTWTKQAGAAFGASSFTDVVHFWDVNNGVAIGDPVGGKFEVYTTANAGVTWSPVLAANLPTPLAAGEYGYTGAFSVQGNAIWFGTDGGRLIRSTDKGLTWTAINTPVADFGGGTTKTTRGQFTFKDDNHGVILKENYTVTGSGATEVITYASVNLYSTVDGGVTWNEITPVSGVFHSDIAYAGTGLLISCGSSTGDFGSSYSTDDGVTWSLIDGQSHTCLEFNSDAIGYSGGFATSATVGGIHKFQNALGNQSFSNGKSISVTPNPTNGLLHLSANSLINEVVVFDLLGKQVYSSKYSALNEVNLDLSSVQNGAYLLKATSDNGITETMKIIKN
jgi:Secretion system C-terminal sorting domain